MTENVKLQVSESSSISLEMDSLKQDILSKNLECTKLAQQIGVKLMEKKLISNFVSLKTYRNYAYFNFIPVF